MSAEKFHLVQITMENVFVVSSQLFDWVVFVL